MLIPSSCLLYSSQTELCCSKNTTAIFSHQGLWNYSFCLEHSYSDNPLAYSFIFFGLCSNTSLSQKPSLITLQKTTSSPTFTLIFLFSTYHFPATMLSSMTTGLLLIVISQQDNSVWHSNICWMNKSDMSLLPKTKFLLSILNKRNRCYLPRFQLLQGNAT